jgi:hypothetical protein
VLGWSSDSKAASGKVDYETLLLKIDLASIVEFRRGTVSTDMIP